MSEGGLKAIKAIAGGVVLLLLVVTVARWYGDYRISATDKVLDQVETPPQGEGSEASKPEDETEKEQPEPSDEKPAETPEAKTVVVMTDGLNFRENPEKGSDVIRGLDKGEKLVLVEKKGDWYHVKDSDGNEGWISASPSYSKIQ